MDPRLNIVDMPNMRKLHAFSGFMSYIGGLAVIADAGLRVAEINAIRTEGGDWMRESSVQLTGFGAGGAFGGLAGKYTVAGGTLLAAKAGLVVAGPVGWAVIGVVLCAGLLSGLGTGYYLDKGGRALSYWIWDRSR